MRRPAAAGVKGDRRFTKVPTPLPSFPDLTTRDYYIGRLKDLGYSYTQIADWAGLSRRQIIRIVKRIRRRKRRIRR